MIVYFSGTGNSRAVAQRLGSLLCDSLYEISGIAAARPSEAAMLSLAAGDSRIVWVFPTYSWGVPPVVGRFIRDIRTDDSVGAAVHWMVTTCGDDTGRTDGVFRRLVEARGWKAAGAAFSVIMPNTYTLMKGFDVDTPEVAAAKLEAMPAAVERIAAVIDGRGERQSLIHRGAFARIKTAIVYPWFKKYAMSARPFHTTAACTACGLCSRKCPLMNIEMTADGPRWHDNCALCLRCYHICPCHAVAYGKATEGKGQYMFH